MNRYYVAGHNGMVGSAIVRALRGQHVITIDRDELDLRDEKEVYGFMMEAQPTHVIMAAAKVGGIKANSDSPAEFLFDNLRIQNNLIGAAHAAGVKKLLFLGSSCIYPKFCAQPIVEESLLSGSLEPTNEAYAVAKIAGIKLCQAFRSQYGCDFISVMPCNLYGPNDNFDTETGHALPAIMAKIQEAKESGRDVELWGNGNARREWLHVDDLARACLLLMEEYSDSLPINVGYGLDYSIRALADMIARVVGFEGEVRFNGNGLDGTFRKLLDSRRMHKLGWKPEVSLEDGLEETFKWWMKNRELVTA